MYVFWRDTAAAMKALLIAGIVSCASLIANPPPEDLKPICDKAMHGKLEVTAAQAHICECLFWWRAKEGRP
jgi:dihydrodipicolinate synthase/N-acetylneuraminate lyase